MLYECESGLSFALDEEGRHEVAGMGPDEFHAEILRGLASLLEESPAVLLRDVDGQANALLGEGLAGCLFESSL